MKTALKLTCLSIAALVSLALAGAPAYADEATDQKPVAGATLQISPVQARVTLDAGEVLEGDHDHCPNDLEGGCIFEVSNTGTEPFHYRVYVSPYSVQGENYNVSFTESTSYTQIARWVQFKDASGNWKNEVTNSIKPGETQTIAYRITVPEDIPGGSQYAAIWAEKLNDSSISGTGVQTIARTGLVIHGRSTGDTRQTSEISEFNFDRFSFKGPLNASATVKNTGNTDFRAFYTYTAKTLFGKELYSEKDSIATYPDTEYHIKTSWDEAPWIGVMIVTWRISAADNVLEQTRLVVIMPVFATILLILFLTVLVIWIIIIIRKRKERKARNLV